MLASSDKRENASHRSAVIQTHLTPVCSQRRLAVCDVVSCSMTRCTSSGDICHSPRNCNPIRLANTSDAILGRKTETISSSLARATSAKQKIISN